MKLRRVRVENVRSFLEPAELLLDGDISIIIGPNGGGKTNSNVAHAKHILVDIIRGHKVWLVPTGRVGASSASRVLKCI